MNVILDILGSFVVRASIVAIILTTMVNLNEFLYRQTERAALNELVAGPGEVITNDLKLAGFGPSTSKTFARARVDEMRFSADVDNSGDAETVYYYYTGSGTNKILYRRIDSETPLMIARNVETFELEYFTATGASTTGNNVTGIKSVKVTLVIRSKNMITSTITASGDSTYLSSTWQRLVFPSNL